MAFSRRLSLFAVGATTAVSAALAFGAPAPGQTPTPGIVASDFAFAAAGGGAPSGPPPPPPPTVAPAASGLTVSAIQRGFAVRGSVKVARAGSRLLARIDGLRAALLAKGGGTYPVGDLLRRSVAAKRVVFSVPLRALGRRALHRRGRLAIFLRVTVTPTTGKAYTALRRVSLRLP